MGLSPNVHYELMIRAAYYYYIKEYTQTRIAEMLGVSRLTLGRILKEAKATGVVKIDIVDSRDMKTLLDMEDALVRRFHLENALVCSSIGSSSKDVSMPVSYAGAQLLSRSVRSGMTISLAWGRTLSLMLDKLSPDHSVKDITVMTLMGGGGTTESYIQPGLLASTLSMKYSGRGLVINAPFFCQSEEVCESLKLEPRVREVLEQSIDSDITLIGIGEEPNFESYWAKNSYPRETLQRIIDSGAVADVCGHYINAKGEPCCPEISRRLVGIDLDTLKKHKCVIAVGGGDEKHRSIKAALLGGYIDVLVTDQHTAEALLRD